MKPLKLLAALMIVLLAACSPKKSAVPVVGFVDAFEDATIALARTGFTVALKKIGFCE